MEQNKKEIFKNMFFTLKILALLFCTAPMFQYYFGDSINHAMVNINLGMAMVFLGIIVIVTFMWFFNDDT